MLTIAPLACATICRPKAWAQFHTPLTLTSITNRHSSAVTSRAGRWMQAPALFTSTSIWPSRSMISATAAVDLARVGHVSHDGLRRDPEGLELGDSVDGAVGVADQQHHVAPGLGECSGQGPADARDWRR